MDKKELVRVRKATIEEFKEIKGNLEINRNLKLGEKFTARNLDANKANIKIKIYGKGNNKVTDIESLGNDSFENVSFKERFNLGKTLLIVSFLALAVIYVFSTSILTDIGIQTINITASDKVGIGLTNPSEALEVNGSIEINNGAATGTDVIKGHKIFYAGDETEVSTNSTTWTLKKEMTSVFDSSYSLNPRYFNVLARIRNSGGNITSLNVTLEGCGEVVLTTTSTSYSLEKGTIDISGCSDGAYPTNVALKTNDVTGTAYNDVIEFWFIE